MTTGSSKAASSSQHIETPNGCQDAELGPILSVRYGMIHQRDNWLSRISPAMDKLAVGLTLLGAIDVLNHSSVGATQRRQEQAIVESPTTLALRAARESATSALQEGICVGGGRFTLTVSSSKVSISWLLAL